MKCSHFINYYWITQLAHIMVSLQCKVWKQDTLYLESSITFSGKKCWVKHRKFIYERRNEDHGNKVVKGKEERACEKLAEGTGELGEILLFALICCWTWPFNPQNLFRNQVFCFTLETRLSRVCLETMILWGNNCAKLSLSYIGLFLPAGSTLH